MLPPAPGLLSTMTGRPSAAVSCSATQRARMSRGLAAGPGAMTRIGPVGYSWADALRNAETTSGARSTQRRVGIMRLASMRSGKHVLSRLEDELEFSANLAYALVRESNVTPVSHALERCG